MNYIINDDEQYLREGNYYAEVGSFVHKILEMIFKGELTQDDALQYYLDNYKNNVLYKVKNKSTMDKTYALLADFFASIDLSWVDNYEIRYQKSFKGDDLNILNNDENIDYNSREKNEIYSRWF